MKRLTVLLLVLALMLNSSLIYAASYFTNNKELDKTFQQLEKSFMQSEKLESVPSKVIAGKIYSEKMPKMSDKLIKAAVQQKLNDIRVAIEIQEERLGGLSAEEYKMISAKLLDNLIIAGKGSFHWEDDKKSIYLYFGLSDDDYFEFDGLVGNFKRMGKEKDEVNLSDLHVRSKIIRYLNQSIQKGDKVSPQIMAQLPGEVERLFIERNLSKIMAARILSEIHSGIYNREEENSYADNYDGSQSIDELINSYSSLIDSRESDREEEKRIEFFEYPQDLPSVKNRDYITERLVDGDLSEDFAYEFNKTMTLDDLTKLYFGSKELDENIEINDNAIPADSPDYIKLAYIYGMIDDTSNLKKPLTRLEAARILVRSAIYDNWSDLLKITDCNKIPYDDQISVGSCILAGMKTKIDKFDPQSNYTKEEAIVDCVMFNFKNLRGYHIPIGKDDPSKIIVGKNTINVLFEEKDEIKEYFEYYFEDTVLEKIKLTENYTRIDTGCVLIELFTPENGIKFTVKNGTKYIDFDDGLYSPALSYTIEAKVLKSTDKVDMNMQPDSVTKKLYTKLDAILAKIIKPGMSQYQKVKAIHDYVVTHVTYDSKYRDNQSVGSVIIAIDQGRGVCGDYSLLFKALCQRISIPCVYEDDLFTLQHAWNAVFINGQWLFVDTTWDDHDNGKVLYTYFLKDRFTFMKDHKPLMGVPDIKYYSDEDLDPMKLKNQDEVRAYLLKNFYWVNGYKLTFKLTDKNIKPTIGYMNDPDVKVVLSYDSKNDLYTVTAKAR